MTNKKLSKLILTRKIHNKDLSSATVNGKDFSCCSIKEVKFPKDKKYENISFKNASLSEIDFKDATLKNVDFENAVLSGITFENATLIDTTFENATLVSISFDQAALNNCSFQIPVDKSTRIIDKTTISKTSFRDSKLEHCRFRNAGITWSDFRYSEISNTTFEGAKIEYCDFYRTYFSQINIFNRAIISKSSLNYTYFEGTIIRKDNLDKHEILQQNFDEYKKFLVDWKTFAFGPRKDHTGKEWKPEDLERTLNARFSDAENIYKNLNGLWHSKGFLGDGNWAYVQGRRMERMNLGIQIKNKSTTANRTKLKILRSWNKLCDLAFGYGESITKMISTYIVIVLLFAVIFHFTGYAESFLDSLGSSFKNMIAQGEINDKMLFLVNLLTIIQSTLGILLTGIFGFILANKIRNQ
ncbi:MAG: pentapeptide repeat-containing protein [Ignavibacteria bacterium]|jgi:uncharacterized protein YjbI with pentapeptide repeats